LARFMLNYHQRLSASPLMAGPEAFSVLKPKPIINMSNMSARAAAVAAIAARQSQDASVNFIEETPETVFGANTFNLAVMKETLKPATYQAVVETVQNGTKLPEGVADEVAEAMKNWAVSRGATHFAHVFYPLTGSSAPFFWLVAASAWRSRT